MLHNLNFIDYIIIGVMALSIILGLLHGFLRSLISVGIWIGAFIIAAHYGPHLATTFSLITNNPDTQLWLSYGVIFICAVVIGFVIKLILNLILTAGEGVGIVDRFVGAIFGCIRGAILVVLFLWFALLVGVNQNPAFQQSQLTPFFAGLLTDLENYFPSINQNAQNALDVIKSSAVGQVVQQGKTLYNSAQQQEAPQSQQTQATQPNS